MRIPLLLALLCALIAAGCGPSSDDSPATAPVLTETADPNVELPPAATTRPADALDAEVSAVRSLVELFWTQQFADWGRTYQPLNSFGWYQRSRLLFCGQQEMPAENAFYCSDGDFIAYDRDWLLRYYEQIGDGAVYVVIPHEFGHAVQARLGTSSDFSIEAELQADCFAGAFVAGALQSGSIVEEPGDAGEMFGNLANAADPTDEWWRPGAHGTASQRQSAFGTGLAGGANSC